MKCDEICIEGWQNKKTSSDSPCLSDIWYWIRPRTNRNIYLKFNIMLGSSVDKLDAILCDRRDFILVDVTTFPRPWLSFETASHLPSWKNPYSEFMSLLLLKKIMDDLFGLFWCYISQLRTLYRSSNIFTVVF